MNVTAGLSTSFSWLLSLVATALGAVAAVRAPRRASALVRRLELPRDLLRGGTWVVDRPQDWEIACKMGCIWITHDGDPRDIVLEDGDIYRSHSNARMLIHALADARVLLAPPPRNA